MALLTVSNSRSFFFTYSTCVVHVACRCLASCARGHTHIRVVRYVEDTAGPRRAPAVGAGADVAG